MVGLFAVMVTLSSHKLRPDQLCSTTVAVSSVIMVNLRSRCGHHVFILWLWSPYVIGQTIIFLPLFLSSFFFSSPNLSSRRLDIYHTLTRCGPSANLECRSEMCCTRLAANTGRKKVAKNRHLGTIPQLCRAISLQLRHVSTIGKNLLSSNISPTCPTIW